MAKKTYNVIAQVACKSRKGWTSSVGLTFVEVHATTKRGAILAAKREWKRRGELPVPGTHRKARCELFPSAEEV